MVSMRWIDNHLLPVHYVGKHISPMVMEAHR